MSTIVGIGLDEVNAPALGSAITDVNGFTQLARLHASLSACPTGPVNIDCSQMEWFDANLAAALRALSFLHSQQGRHPRFVNLSQSIKGVLAPTGLFPTIKAPRRPTVVPLRQFMPGDAKKFAGYTFDHISNKGIPVMSTQLQKRFFEGIDEMFQNAEIHSKTELGMFACGQLYPARSRLNFSLVDLGVGFFGAISSVRSDITAHSAAIDWAMRGRNTTRQLDVPGGLGLKVLREFIKLNNGKLTVFSCNGFWSADGSKVVKQEIDHPFPGTIVNLEVNTADKNIYRLRGEIDPASVF